MASPGDSCPCGHYLTVVDSKRAGESRVQYLGCTNCNRRPPDNKIVTPLKLGARWTRR
jgi:hypothetical protein